MNEETLEEPPKSPVPGKEPVEEDVGQSTEKKSSEAENTSQTAPAQEPMAHPDSLDTKENPSSDPLKENKKEIKEEAKDDIKVTAGEPPVDWFEPLEEDDDDADSVSRNDAEEESLAGESERSESVPGSEKTFKKIYQLNVPRRKRSHPDEGWVEWPILGEGWKRKEVVRRSGSSIGQKDVYYLGPRGDRVRSRVELVSVLEGFLDLSTFNYKTGKFYEGVAAPTRARNRAKRKIRERSSSESSWVERGEGADTPDSHHRLTPSQVPKNLSYNQTSFSSNSTTGASYQVPRNEERSSDVRIKLPPPSLYSKPIPIPSINGDVMTEDNTLFCAKCGISFIGTWYDKQRKRPCCPGCWAASKTKEHPMIRFRKWIPCGQCVGCHNNVNCGLCANCKHGLQSPESRKRICRKRKCICPIRKGPGSAGYMPPTPYNDIPDAFDDLSFQSEVTESQACIIKRERRGRSHYLRFLPICSHKANKKHLSLKSSDTENFSVNVDVDDEDDLSTDDDDDWHKKRKRRSCGECKACLCRKDCGTCDFCIDKPKFGGSNKKRQKCRLRQCQRQAMRHLLPFQMGQGDFGPDGQMLPGRPRPHYTYSRKSNFKKNRASASGLDFTDNEDDDLPMSWISESASVSKHSYELSLRNHQSSMQFNHLDFGQRNGLPDRVPHIGNHHSELDHLSRWDAERSHSKYVDDDDDDEEEDELPMITQIFSLADNPASSGADVENQLMKLLHSLRSSVLPILWYAIMVEGPQLQLIQCSKQSTMSDTIVLIDPGFCYQVTVQKQPLLPTHSLYDMYPGRLTSVTEVVNLLLGLEKYVMCQGLPPKQPSSNKDPVILARASTCDFLVKRKVSICVNCRALRGL